MTVNKNERSLHDLITYPNLPNLTDMIRKMNNLSLLPLPSLSAIVRPG